MSVPSSLNHVRRWRFFYLAAALWATAVVVVPSRSPHRSGPGAADPFSAAASAPGDPGAPASVAGAPIPSTPDGTAPGTTQSTLGQAGDSGPVASLVQESTAALVAEGKSRGGVVCRPGAPQVDFTDYGPGCVVAFTGNNGGATSNGVTGSTITIAAVTYNPSAIDPNGGSPSAAEQAVFDTFLNYFNKTFELYGRKVVFVNYKSPHGDELAMAQGQGQDAACQDAIALSQEQHAFGIVYTPYTVFQQCAAQQHLIVTEAEGRPPEPFLDKYHPYLWTLEQPCYRLADQLAEYVRKRLVGRPARYAGDPAYRTRTRKIGIMVPDNDIYKPCIAQAKAAFGAPVDEFDYTPDVSRLPDQAAQAAVRFKADGVTTVIMNEAYSTIALTAAARSQAWYPEWVVSGAGNADQASAARMYDATEVTGHLFGRTEDTPPLVQYGPGSEPARLYQRLTGHDLDYKNVYSGGYYVLLQVFRLLQSAGPDLTPASLGHGALRLPEGTGSLGALSYDYGPNGDPNQVDHGAILDANEIYWDASATAADGKSGTYIYNPRRYRSGQWPTTPPDVYP